MQIVRNTKIVVTLTRGEIIQLAKNHRPNDLALASPPANGQDVTMEALGTGVIRLTFLGPDREYS